MMQVQSEVKVSRSESLVIVIAVAVCLAAIILALPTAGSSGNIPSLSAGNLEIPIAGTITVALLVVIVALPLAFFSAVCVFMLPHTAKEKMFTVLLVIAQSPNPVGICRCRSPVGLNQNLISNSLDCLPRHCSWQYQLPQVDNSDFGKLRVYSSNLARNPFRLGRFSEADISDPHHPQGAKGCFS